MKTFNNLGQFAKFLAKQTREYPTYEKKAANFLGEVLEKEAQDKIGHLQSGSGEFPAWQELAESTKADKERQGYVFNSDYNPLYRTGELKDSISFVFNMIGRVLYLGSTSEIMIYQELGTRTIPPRSVLGLTMFQAAVTIHYVLSKMLKAWITGQPMVLRRGTYGSI